MHILYFVVAKIMQFPVGDIGEVEDNVISSTKSKEVCSEILVVLNVVIYLACWLCNGKVVQEESIGVCSNCGAEMKSSRCKRSLIVDFNIDGHNRVKAYTDVVESVIDFLSPRMMKRLL